MQRDPQSLRYQRGLFDLITDVYGYEQAYVRVASLTRGPLRTCYEAGLRKDWRRVEQLLQVAGARDCATYVLLAAGVVPRAAFERAAQLASRHDLGRIAVTIAEAYERKGRRDVAVQLLQRNLAHETAPRDRLYLGNALVRMLFAARQNRRATQLHRQLDMAVQRSGLPGLIFMYYTITPSVAPQDDFRLTARLAQRHGAYGHCALALSNLLHDEIDRGQMQAAVRDGPQAVACADQSAADFQRAMTRIYYGRAMAKSGDPRGAEKMLLAAWPFANRSGPRYARAEVWHNLAHSYEAQGRWRDASQAVERFIALAEPTGQSQQIVSYRDAGIIYWNSGDQRTARLRFESMVQFIERGGHEFFWAGEYYERIGDLARARTYYWRALREDGNEARETAGLVRVYLALEELDSAAVFARMHDASQLTPEEVLLAPVVDAARGNHAAALAASAAWAAREESQRNQQGAINAHLQRAEIALAAGNFVEAEAAARRARHLALANNLRAEAAQALIYVGTAQNARTPGAAMSVLLHAAAGARAAAQDKLLSIAWAALGDAYLRRGQPRAALSAYDSACAAAQRTAGHFEDSFDRARYRSAMSLRLTQAAWRAVRAGQPDLLYQWSVRRKSSATGRLALGRLQASLPPRGAVIDYLVADSGVAALVITRDTVAVVRLAGDRASLRSLVEKFRAPIAVSFGSLDRTRARFEYAAAARLYDLLLRPLVPLLQGSDRWFIVPDDALHLVPFDAFVDTRGGARRFVIDEVTTTYLSSVDAIRYARTVGLQKVVVVGAQAPGLRNELAAIRTTVPHATQLVDPTEARVRRSLAGASVLHFAVHAEADARQPLSSYLQLLRGDGSDGQYRVSEIAADHASPDLVVLSACETLYGRVFAGGPLSLAGAFTAGGAFSVIATQWPVGERSADFARVLYRELAQHANAADAVRAARLTMRRSPATSDPILWAPFQLLTGRAAF